MNASEMGLLKVMKSLSRLFLIKSLTRVFTSVATILLGSMPRTSMQSLGISSRLISFMVTASSISRPM